MAPMTPAQFLTTTPLGTRVVVRSKIDGGFTDALGYLRGRSDVDCTVETRRGLTTVALDDVVAAKEVPPPPPRRRPLATT
jgi:hypothetical protein